jgi:hypothetical protein
MTLIKKLTLGVVVPRENILSRNTLYIFLPARKLNKPYNDDQMKKLNHYYKLLQDYNNENKNPAPHLVLESH